MVVGMAGEMEERRVSHRVIHQLLASGTSIGANVFEADEAMSRPDFVKCLAIAAKELAETRFWLRLAGRHSWVSEDRIGLALTEAEELRRILGTMIRRTKEHGA